MMRFTVCSLLISLFITKNSYSQQLNVSKLDSLISVVNANNKIMGALTVSKKGKVLYNRAWGYRTISDKEQLKSNTETKYRIGSISKMFTSVMILQLMEEGKIRLSTPLATYYPNIPNAKDITIEQMLTHRSGLYNFTDSVYLTYNTEPRTHEQLIALFEQQTPAFQPGEKGEYSNTNFVLLGYIIENITGESYSSNLKKRITGKIGLKNTYYGSKPDPAKNEASSFDFNGISWQPKSNTDMSIPGGAGALVSTTNDLVKFEEALFAGKLVKKATLDRMVTLKEGYGLGIFQFPFDEKYAYGHTGGIDEFHSMVGYFPQDSLAFAFTGNGQVIQMNDLAIGLLSIYFNRPYTIPDYTKEAYKLADAELRRYEGIYSSNQIALKITIKKDGDKLQAQATGQGAFYLTPVNEKEFKFDPARITMFFDVEKNEPVKTFTLKQNGGNYVFMRE